MKQLRNSFLIFALGATTAMAWGTEPIDDNVQSGPPSDAAPISVESDQPSPPPTEQQVRRRLREALGPRQGTLEERLLGDGTLEVTTRIARFCAKPSPGPSQSGIGGSITLAAPCAAF